MELSNHRIFAALVVGLLAAASCGTTSSAACATSAESVGGTTLRADGATIEIDRGAAALERIAAPGRVEAVAWSSALQAFVVAAHGALWAVAPGLRTRRLGATGGHVSSISVADPVRLLAVTTSSSRRGVELFAVTGARLRHLGGGVEPARRPTRVALGDVDGDGRIEALVLVTGRARFDRRLALRPFVYGWDGRRLYPKWLGSRLSRPFDDATLGDIDSDGRAEIVALERARDGTHELTAYRWRGFGFERIATSGPCGDACGLMVDASGAIVVTADGALARYRVGGDQIARVPPR